MRPCSSLLIGCLILASTASARSAEPLLVDREMEVEGERFEALQAVVGDRIPHVPWADDVVVRWGHPGLPGAQPSGLAQRLAFGPWTVELSYPASAEPPGAGAARLIVSRGGAPALFELPEAWSMASEAASSHLGEPQPLGEAWLLPVVTARCGDERCMFQERQGWLYLLPETGAASLIARVDLSRSVERRRGGSFAAWPEGGFEDSAAALVRPVEGRPPLVLLVRFSGVWGDLIGEVGVPTTPARWARPGADCAPKAVESRASALWSVEECQQAEVGRFECHRAYTVAVEGVASRRVSAEEHLGYVGTRLILDAGLCVWAGE